MTSLSFVEPAGLLAAPRARATMASMGPAENRSDRELVAAARAGDSRAFSSLLRRHDRAMRSLASAMVSRRADVDDVLQDAYVKAYRAIDSFRGDAAFSTWLYQIVYRTCLDRKRSETRGRADLRLVEPLDETRERPGKEHFDSIDQLALGDALRQALMSLSPDHRAAVVLVDGEGYSYDEVAEILGVRPGTVGSRVNRARQALRAAYEQNNASDGERR